MQRSSGWRESDGHISSMNKFGAGFIQFWCGSHRSDPAGIYLQGPVTDYDDVPLFLESDGSDPYGPYRLVWRSGLISNLDLLNPSYAKYVTTGEEFLVNWRREQNGETIEFRCRYRKSEPLITA